MYIVIEMQTNADGSVGIPPVASFEDWHEAEARYHSILSVAAVSSVPVHSAAILTNAGVLVKSESYDHREVGE